MEPALKIIFTVALGHITMDIKAPISCTGRAFIDAQSFLRLTGNVTDALLTLADQVVVRKTCGDLVFIPR